MEFQPLLFECQLMNWFIFYFKTTEESEGPLYCSSDDVAADNRPIHEAIYKVSNAQIIIVLFLRKFNMISIRGIHGRNMGNSYTHLNSNGFLL